MIAESAYFVVLNDRNTLFQSLHQTWKYTLYVPFTDKETEAQKTNCSEIWMEARPGLNLGLHFRACTLTIHSVVPTVTQLHSLSHPMP